ncbi:MAG: IS1380 family transposase [Elusimicrobiales bacterium]|jgi:hypothetical protein
MIARNLHRLKVEKTSASVTSFAGIPLLTELAHSTGTIKRLDAIGGLWRRKSEYRTSDYIIGLAMTLAAGGETLDDTRLLRGDAALCSLALPDLPCANTIGEFLRRFDNRSLYRFSEVVTVQGLCNMAPGQDLTLDIDSTIIESDKAAAKMTYKGVKGYNPILAWLAGPDIFMGGVFRDGNASPQTHILPLLKYCRKRLPAGTRFKFRSDSAGYKISVMKYCHDEAIPFTISADINEAVRETIDSIPEKDWRLVIRGEDTFLLAETVYAPDNSKTWLVNNLPSFRLIVTKKLGQLELFGDPLKRRAIITNLPPEWATESVLDFHNDRGNAEKAIGELKNGYGLNKLPCSELKANAAYFQTALLAYNLVATLKNRALPGGWKSFGIKNLRFRLICQAAVVARHARRVVIKLGETYPFFDVFEQARWAVLNPALSCG